MLIQIHTNNHVTGSANFDDYVKRAVEGALGHFGDRITRVEVRINDENSHKSGPDDKSCAMEAHIVGRPPAVVTHHAASFEQAVDGALGKLKRALTSTFERLRDRTHTHGTHQEMSEDA